MNINQGDNMPKMLSEASITLALIASVAAMVLVAIFAADVLGATRLPDIGLVLAGALAGTKIPR